MTPKQAIFLVLFGLIVFSGPFETFLVVFWILSDRGNFSPGGHYHGDTSPEKVPCFICIHDIAAGKSSQSSDMRQQSPI